MQDLEIVGTELRSVERITGRLTRGKMAAAAGAHELLATMPREATT